MAMLLKAASHCGPTAKTVGPVPAKVPCSQLQYRGYNRLYMHRWCLRTQIPHVSAKFQRGRQAGTRRQGTTTPHWTRAQLSGSAKTERCRAEVSGMMYQAYSKSMVST